MNHSYQNKAANTLKILGQTLKGTTLHQETIKPISNPKSNLLISQFRRENERWRRTLGFLIEEDIILKAGISDILKNMTETDEGIVKRLEQFHNRLMKENDTVRVLRAGVADVKKELNRDFYFDTDFSNSITRLQRILRKQIETVEMESLKLKFDFNEYIDGILQNAS